MRVCENQEGAYTLSLECICTHKRVCTHPQESVYTPSRVCVRTLKSVCTRPQESVYPPSKVFTHSQVSFTHPQESVYHPQKISHTFSKVCEKNSHEFGKIVNHKCVNYLA